MNVGAVDRSATLGGSWLHAASPAAKLVALGFALVAVVVSWNVILIVSLAIAIAAATVSSRAPLRLALGLAAYPGLFALVFALSSAPDAMTGAVIVGKAVTAALAAVTVVLTTPYPYIFAPLQRVTPSIVGDALLMTYRSTFLLLDKSSALITAARIRSGLGQRHPLKAARTATRALGGLLLYALDLSQRDYDIMRLRGYEGRLRVTPPRPAAPLRDAAFVAAAITAAAVAVVWRLGAADLNPYSWILPVVPGVLLTTAAFHAWRRR